MDESPEMGLRLKVPDAPEGKPVTARLTAPVNPDKRTMVTLKVGLAPRTTVWLVGEAEIEKSGG